MGFWECLGEVSLISLTEVESPAGLDGILSGPALLICPYLKGRLRKEKDRRQQIKSGGHPVNIVIHPNLFLLVLIYPKQKGGGQKTSLPGYKEQMNVIISLTLKTPINHILNQTSCYLALKIKTSSNHTLAQTFCCITLKEQK